MEKRAGRFQPVSCCCGTVLDFQCTNMRDFFAQSILYFCNHVVCHLPSHGLRLWFYRNLMAFDVADRTAIFLNCVFDARHNFSLGAGSVINERCRMDNRGGLEIGRSVSISSDVIILTADHDPESETFEGRMRPVKIGDYSWVGTRAMILPGVTVGRGAVVAAGSVVTKSVADHTIVAGVPARPVKTRTSNLRYDCYYKRLFH